MNIILLCALLTGLGLWLLVRAIPRRPDPPDLAAWLAARRRRLAPTAQAVAGSVGSPIGAVLAPLLRDLAGALARRAERVGLAGHARLTRRLALVDGGTATDHYLRKLTTAIVVGLCVAGLNALLVALWAGDPDGPAFPWWVPLAAALAGSVIPDLQLARAVKAYQEQILADLPPLLDGLTITLAAGLGLAEAVRRAARRPTPLGAALAAIVDEQRLSGRELAAGLRALADRLDLPELHAVATTVGLAEHDGVNPIELLARQAVELEAAERQRLLLAGQRAAVAMLVPLGACFLPALAIAVCLPAAGQFFGWLGR